MVRRITVLGLIAALAGCACPSLDPAPDLTQVDRWREYREVKLRTLEKARQSHERYRAAREAEQFRYRPVGIHRARATSVATAGGYGPTPTKREILAALAIVKRSVRSPTSFHLVRVSSPSMKTVYAGPNTDYVHGWSIRVDYRTTNLAGGVVPGMTFLVLRNGGIVHRADYG